MTKTTSDNNDGLSVNPNAVISSPKINRNSELFYINGSQGKLAARLSLPDLQSGEKCPMVIFSHGFGGDMTFHLFESIIERLNQNGIGVLRYDFNGCGKSEGDFKDMTVRNEIEDLINVIAYVRQLPVTKNISLLGHSQGGVVTSMVAGDCGYPQIECEVLLSAASVLRDDALRGMTHGGHFDPWHLDQPTYEVGGGHSVGRPYIQTAMTLPIYETASKYAGPALIINGMADMVVPYTYAERYHNILKDSEIIIIPGENHTYNYSTNYVVELVSNWLIQRLRVNE
ncbi:MAG: alpha/beta hydrolase [Muribaculaceae bacterium]|nr:alpha/beta hydrolase [Muribaculaceae bacterium]